MMNAKGPSRRDILAAATAGVAGLAAPWAIGSARAGAAIRIGHLTDVSGPYSANSGAVSIACARQAIEDICDTVRISGQGQDLINQPATSAQPQILVPMPPQTTANPPRNRTNAGTPGWPAACPDTSRVTEAMK